MVNAKAATGSNIWPHVDWSLISVSQGEGSLEEALISLEFAKSLHLPKMKKMEVSIKGQLEMCTTDCNRWRWSKCSIGPLAAASQAQTAAEQPSGSQISI